MKVVVIAPDKPAALKRYWEREGLPFTGASDPEHRVARMYGQEVRLLKLGRLPMAVVIDEDGRVRRLHRSGSMADLPDLKGLLNLAE